MKILIAGSSGFLGSAVRRYLAAEGYTVCRLVRHKRASAKDEIQWNPYEKIIPTEKLSHFDVVINLCGENLMGLWTPAKKQRIYASRIETTALLASAIEANTPRTSVFICASAIGFYGSRGDEVLTEQSQGGGGFLANVCQDWEKAASVRPLSDVRVVNLRFGVVLDAAGGAMAKMLGAFKMGLGGPLGDGTHWQSWIGLTDAVRAIKFAIENQSLSGAVNLVSPNPVRNAMFAKLLAQSLNRPALIKTPACLLRLLPGRFADEVLLSSVRAIPEKLLAASYTFRHPVLRDLLIEYLTPQHSQR